MKLYIPSIGDEICLTKDWTFRLWNECRNESLMEFIGDTRRATYGYLEEEYNSIACTIPAGQILKIDRIYIRKNKEDFDSVTFFWKGARTQPKTHQRTAYQIVATEPMTLGSYITNGFRHPEVTHIEVPYQAKTPAKPVRFWAKLEDVNTIEFEPAGQ